MINYRPLTQSDEPFLWDMLYLAIYVPEGQSPPPREIIHQPEFRRYVEGWSRPGDMGIIALEDNVPLGAAWLRLFSPAKPGYGFVDEDTPELSIAVSADARNQGVGSELITLIFDQVQGLFNAISLSVTKTNPALRLYLKMGFTILKQDGDSLILTKRWQVPQEVSIPQSPPFLFGTVGSPTSTPPKPGGSIGAIQRIAALGLAALELGWVQSVRVSPETCATIRRTGSDHGVAISVHAPYFINLNGSDEEWPKSRQRLMDAAFYGNLAGATDIIFHPGSYFEKPPQEVLPLAIDRLSGCIAELRTAGNPVTLRPETMGKTAMLGSLADTLAMSQAIPGVVPCLDFAHLHARAGDGSMNSKEEWLAVLDAYASALGSSSLQQLHIHLSGIEYNQKGERNHLPVAESDFNLKALFHALHARGCQGRILCESPKMEEDALYMQETWQKIA